MKKIILIVVVLGLISGAYFLFFAKSSKSFTDIVAEKERAVFHVFSYDSHGAPFSTGTGFFIDEKETGVTNFHVIEDVSIAYIKDYEGNVFKVSEVTKINKLADLAEIKISNDSNKNFSYINKSSDAPVKGQDIFIIGNPIRLEGTLSTGIISSIRNNESFQEVQFTAPISGGSSGSPIMNMKGELIAIVTSGYDSEAGQNINFGTTIASLNDLEDADGLIANLNSKDEIFLLNKNQGIETALVLNSIEKQENKTLVNFSYTNLNLQFTHNIMIDIDPDEPTYILDTQTNRKYNLIRSNVGTTDKPQPVETGETAIYTLVFPPLPESTKTISIINENDNRYNFYNVALQDKAPNLNDNQVAFSASTLGFALDEMLNKEYYSAYLMLDDLLTQVDNIDNKAYYKQVQAVTAFLYGDTITAKDLFEESVDLNPMSIEFQYNMYYTYYQLKMFDDALKNINTVVSFDPSELAYRRERAELYYELEYYRDAINEITYVIENTDYPTVSDYYDRAVSKWILDEDPCDDLSDAYYHEDISEEDKDFIYEEYFDMGCD